MKRGLKIILGILILLAVAFGIFLYVSNQGIDQAKKLTYSDIDFEKLSDGSYQGSYEIFPVASKVEAMVEDGELVSIDILDHRHGLGEGAEDIVEDMISQQTIDVDVASGATLSSICIKKAVEDA